MALSGSKRKSRANGTKTVQFACKIKCSSKPTATITSTPSASSNGCSKNREIAHFANLRSLIPQKYTAIAATDSTMKLILKLSLTLHRRKNSKYVEPAKPLFPE